MDAKVKPKYLLNALVLTLNIFLVSSKNSYLLKSCFCSTQLELRKKQFHVLLSTIQELQQTLESECFLVSVAVKVCILAHLLSPHLADQLCFLDDEKSDNDDNSQESPAENGE